MVVGSGAAGAAASLTFRGAFKYNRANYLFDANLRFQRYTSGYQFAVDQAAQYREDIRDFTELTVGRQDMYTVLGALFIFLSFQLLIAGRLGIYGPAPPGWMMGLYLGNSCIALMFGVTAVWLSLHAAARAASGGAQMLTRSVRLPVPTTKQLDKARASGNAFEKQRITDMFRVPFVAPAPKEAAPVVDLESGEKSMAKEKGSDRRMPKWYQDERKMLEGHQTGHSPCKESTPEHFELYRGLQTEWWCHETYVRVGVLYFMTHWLTAVTLYSQCHCFAELRALWPAWSVTPLFCVSNWVLLKIDILPHNHTKLYAFPFQHFHMLMPIVTVFAMSWEYSAVPPGGGWRALIYVLQWFCYASQFLFAIKIYDLAEPAFQDEHPDTPGVAWWPEDWCVPPAFNGAVYLVAPPRTLEPGATCLQVEMQAAKGPRGESAPLRKQRQAHAQMFPWKIFRGALIVAILIWLFIIGGRIWEECHGERYLLKTEGRQIHYPAYVQPGVSSWTRAGRVEMSHAGGSERRVAAEGNSEIIAVAKELLVAMNSLSSSLRWIEKKHQESGLNRAQTSAALTALHADVAWPTGFLPEILVSKGDRNLVAMAKNRHAAMIHLPAHTEVTAENKAKVHEWAGWIPFTFTDIDNLGDVVGASWNSASFILTMSSGAVAECVGMPSAGVLPCRQLGPRILTAGSSIKAASAARVPGSRLIRAAVAFAGEASVALLETMEDGNEWMPAGEIQIRSARGKVPLHFSFSAAADELLISSQDGQTEKWPLAEQPLMPLAALPQTGAKWHAACTLSDGRVAVLATRGFDHGVELLLSSKI